MAGTPAVLLSFFLLHLLSGALLPPMRARPAFSALVESAGRETARRLNRPGRGARERGLRGAATAGAAVLFALVAGAAVDGLGRMPYGFLAEIAFLFLVVSVMAPLKTLRRAVRALEEKKPEAAAALLRPHAPENIDAADAWGIARAGAGWSAWVLNAQCVGPAFWFLLLGAPGAAVYAALAALFRACGGQGAFGRAVRILFAVADAVPCLITVFMTALAAFFVAGARAGRAVTGAFAAPRALFPLGAVAGAVGITLGGPETGWTGLEGTSAKVSVEEMQRAAMLHFVFFICVMMVFSFFVMAVNFISIK